MIIVCTVALIGGCVYSVMLVHGGYEEETRRVLQEVPVDNFRLYIAEGVQREDITDALLETSNLGDVAFAGTFVRFPGIRPAGGVAKPPYSHLVFLNAESSIFEVRHMALASGRFFDEADKHERVVVIGHKVAEDSGWVVGSRLHQFGLLGDYLVVGVLKPMAQTWGFGLMTDDMVFAPLDVVPQYNTVFRAGVPTMSLEEARSQYERLRGETYLWASVKSPSPVSAVAHELAERIEHITGNRAYVQLGVPAAIAHTYVAERTTRSLSMITVVVVLVAMLNLGGLVTMQTFLRGREIGIKRAFGAPGEAIRREYVRHYLALSAVGTVLATAFMLLVWKHTPHSLGLPIAFEPERLLPGAVFLVIIGPLCSLVPISLASEMSPVDAIHDRAAWGTGRRRIDLRQIFIALGFGTAIGTVFFVSAMGSSSAADVDAYLQAVGFNTLVVEEPPAGSVAAMPTLSYDDYRSMAQGELRQYGSLAWVARADVRVGGTPSDVHNSAVFAYEGDIGSARGYELAFGHWPLRGSDVVLGAQIAEKIFGNQSPLGQSVVLGTQMQSYNVVGVLQRRPVHTSDPDNDRDHSVFILFRENNLTAVASTFRPSLVFRAKDEDSVEEARQIIQSSLQSTNMFAEHLQVSQPFSQFMSLKQQRQLFYRSVIAVSIFSIIIACIGVSALTMVQVREMQRTIAIRRSCGAPSSVIVHSVLAELLWVIVAAAVLGLLMAYFLFRLVAFRQGLPMVISPLAVPIGLFVSTLMATGSALIPVQHAVKQPPSRLF